HAARRSGLPREHESKGRRRELVTAADRAAELAIVDAITSARPHDAILAEEGVRTTAGVPSSAADWLWIVDPLDGTTNFVHAVPWFSVSVALYFRGQPLVAAVNAPALGRVWTAALGLGARRDGRAITIGGTQTLADALVATGFSYNRNEPGRDDNVERIRRLLPHCRDLRRFGSAAMDLCLVADGTWDGYWEMYLAPYDVAAGALIVREAGGLVTDLGGGEDWLFGGQVLAANRYLHSPLLSYVGGAPMA
ncbi:MAG: inositol monophosphatase family protein, partial [Planctomycetota bacterium]